MKPLVFYIFLFISFFTYSEDKLDILWPMPKVTNEMCESYSPEKWMMEANKLIDLSALTLYQKDSIHLYIEEAVLRNALINRAYSKLFLEHVKKESPENIFAYWVGSAAYGSDAVGDELRYTFHNRANRELLPKNGKLIKLLNLKKKIGIIAGKMLKIRRLSMYLAYANKSVYQDIFWQFLVGINCSPTKVVELTNNLLERKIHSKDHRAHLFRMKNAWELISNNIGKNFNMDNILKANLILLKDEQEYVLQPKMYSPLAAQTVSLFGFFNHLAKSKLRGVNGKLLSFQQFCKKNKLKKNLSNLNSRMRWLNYIVTEQALYFRYLIKKNRADMAFDKMFAISEHALYDYLPKMEN